MARLPKVKAENLLTGIEQIRQRLEPLLPNEREIISVPGHTWFRLVDNNTVTFYFDPAKNADSHDVEWDQDPDFKNPTSRRLHTRARSVQVILSDAFTCGSKYYFHVRANKGKESSRWSPPAVFKTPVPAALLAMTGVHEVDNVTDENPIINVKMTLPRTATIGGSTIEDFEALWTDHVDVEAVWSTIPGTINDSQTAIVVAAGTALHFKVTGLYKIEETGEIVIIVSVDDGTDTITVARGTHDTAKAATTGATNLRLYVRLLREQFTASENGVYAVILTIPNPEKVRSRSFEAWPVGRCGTRGPMSSVTASLAAAGVIADLVATPLFEQVNLSWSELPWTAYRYEVYHATTGAVQIGDADPTTTGDTRLLSRQLADHAGEAQYIFQAKFAVGVNHFFGVRAVDIFAEFAGGDTAGPLQPDATPTNPAPDVTNISATEGPALEPGSFQPGRDRSRPAQNRSLVTAGFDPPVPAGAYARCRIYMQPTGSRGALDSSITAGAGTADVSRDDAIVLSYWRYFTLDSEVILVTSVDWTTPGSGIVRLSITRAQFGTSAASHTASTDFIPFVKPVPVAEGDTAPLSFTGPPIGNVTLYFVSVSVGGQENAVLSSPNLTVVMDGQTSAPLEVQNLRGLKTPIGGKVFWSEGLEPDLSYYEVADFGSRTLAAQADIVDKHIIARITAIPGGENRAVYEWQETEYEGEISQGSSSVVLGRLAAPLEELVNDFFDPVGASPVKETLRFSRSSDIDDLSETAYDINSNDEDTINLASAPTEATNGNVVVRFYVGGRSHKFYVRAVNDSGLASEWRPVEGTFLELAALAPDGTHDVGPPRIHDAGIPTDAQGFDRASWFIGDGEITVHAAAISDFQDESDFDLALKQNIGGITHWEVRVTAQSPTVTFIFNQPASNEREEYTFNAIIPVVRPDAFWTLGSSSSGSQNFFSFPQPDITVSQIHLRAKNWYGWSPWTLITAHDTNRTLYTGNGVTEPPNSQVAIAAVLHPNVAISKRIETTLTDATTTINEAEHLTLSGTPGAGTAPGDGEVFHIVIIQDGTGGRKVTFQVDYLGVLPEHINPIANAYTVLSFLTEGSAPAKFRLINVFSPRVP